MAALLFIKPHALGMRGESFPPSVVTQEFDTQAEAEVAFNKVQEWNATDEAKSMARFVVIKLY